MADGNYAIDSWAEWPNLVAQLHLPIGVLRRARSQTPSLQLPTWALEVGGPVPVGVEDSQGKHGLGVW